MLYCLHQSDRLDDGKATLTIKRLNSLLRESSLDIIDNSNIGHTLLCLIVGGGGQIANFLGKKTLKLIIIRE